MLCEAVEESGHQLYGSYNALNASAAQSCTLCCFFRERLPLYTRDYALFHVWQVGVETGEWYGGAEEAYEPLVKPFLVETDWK
jgi:hypothetical protein